MANIVSYWLVDSVDSFKVEHRKLPELHLF